ncbi:unannotated protein [freshwater metagenome]|uniref:Unannotated protein n=1 Tax=freshwater metagenome TaxID=449393 RepID=A0A6J6CQ99_9ZZZZ
MPRKPVSASNGVLPAATNASAAASKKTPAPQVGSQTENRVPDAIA